jgi:hypothetical protein
MEIPSNDEALIAEAVLIFSAREFVFEYRRGIMYFPNDYEIRLIQRESDQAALRCKQISRN